MKMERSKFINVITQNYVKHIKEKVCLKPEVFHWAFRDRKISLQLLKVFLRSSIQFAHNLKWERQLKTPKCQELVEHIESLLKATIMDGSSAETNERWVY